MSVAFLGRRPTRVPCTAVCSAPSSVRPVRKPQETQQHKAVRASGVHHGQLRGADSRVPRLHQGRRRLGRPAAQHQPRDAAAEQDPEGDPQEPRQEVYGTFRQHPRRQGQLQEVLRAVQQKSESMFLFCLFTIDSIHCNIIHNPTSRF